jgi:hypothetical protein
MGQGRQRPAADGQHRKVMTALVVLQAGHLRRAVAGGH